MAIYNVNGDALFAASSFSDLYTDSPSFYKIASQGGTVQGGCTDGSYIYYIATGAETLVKIDIATGEKTTVSYESGLYGHGNDMTYNPVTGKIYIVTMEDGVIRQVDPSTLEDEGEIVPLDGEGNVIESSGLAYDRKNNRYIITESHNYTILDDTWTVVKTFSYATSKWTYQGVETDGTYIFRPLWSSSLVENNILVLDMDGNAITQIVLPTISVREIETLANDWAGTWYAIYNGAVFLMGFPRYANYHGVEITHAILSQ